MTAGKKGIISIALLLRQARSLAPDIVRTAAEDAFRDAPGPVRVVEMKNYSGFGVLLGPMRLVVLNVDKPYFKDIPKLADRITNFPAREAVQHHTAWLSVDLADDPPDIPREKVYVVIGKLVAEFLGEDVLGLIRRPGGPVIGYDISFISMFRNGKAAEVFGGGPPDRITRVRSDTAGLAAAAEEARRCWGEFLVAFKNRKPHQHFAVKKAFVDQGKNEHMWVSVSTIDGSTIRGWLSNTPAVIKSLKLQDPVELLDSEIEDWIYTNGNENVGGFQAKVLRKR